MYLIFEINSAREPFDADKDTVYSYVTIQVEKDLFDAYDEKFITVKIRGGDTETMKTIADFAPSYVLRCIGKSSNTYES